MKRLQVHWAKKKTRGPLKGELKHIGGIDINGETWILPVDKAIDGINSGICEFYILEDWVEIPVTVCTLNESETFLTSNGHGYLYNLLEELPECSFA